MTTIDPYATLGIPAAATTEVAARAHRRLAKRFHPDVNAGQAASDRMRDINEAWSMLSNPVRRAEYDAGVRAARKYATHWSTRGPGAYRGADRTHWTTWPDGRQGWAEPGVHPNHVEDIDRSFGNRPIVVVAAWVILTLFYVIGAWLGSIGP